jgi:ligand-binding sensor domain-containing protein
MDPPSLSRAALCLPLLWVGTGVHAAWALDRDRSIAHHALDEWTTEQGLPRNTVEAVTQTPDGLLWFATSDGLALLEGERFRSWTQADFPELTALSLTAIEAGHEPGVLWLGTEGSGLLRFDYHTDSYEVYREDDRAPWPAPCTRESSPPSPSRPEGPGACWTSPRTARAASTWPRSPTR